MLRIYSFLTKLPLVRPGQPPASFRRSAPMSPLEASSAQFGPIVFWRGMSKLKTRRAAAKRFRLRGNGEITRSRSGKSHNTGYKTRGRVNRLGTSTTIAEKAIEKRMRLLLGMVRP